MLKTLDIPILVSLVYFKQLCSVSVSKYFVGTHATVTDASCRWVTKVLKILKLTCNMFFTILVIPLTLQDVFCLFFDRMFSLVSIGFRVTRYNVIILFEALRLSSRRGSHQVLVSFHLAKQSLYRYKENENVLKLSIMSILPDRQ